MTPPDFWGKKILTMQITKQKFFEMLLIAFLSALIAFLQNLLANLINEPIITNSIPTASTIGGVLGTARFFKYV